MSGVTASVLLREIRQAKTAKEIFDYLLSTNKRGSVINIPQKLVDLYAIELFNYIGGLTTDPKFRDQSTSSNTYSSRTEQSTAPVEILLKLRASTGSNSGIARLNTRFWEMHLVALNEYNERNDSSVYAENFALAITVLLGSTSGRGVPTITWDLLSAWNEYYLYRTGQIELPPPPSGFEPEYQAVLDFATGQGYTLPSTEIQDLQNELVFDLKTLALWDNMDCLYITSGDASAEEFAMINWKNPSLGEMLSIDATSTYEGKDGVDIPEDTGSTITGWTFASASRYQLEDASIGILATSNLNGAFGPDYTINIGNNAQSSIIFVNANGGLFPLGGIGINEPNQLVLVSPSLPNGVNVVQGIREGGNLAIWMDGSIQESIRTTAATFPTGALENLLGAGSSGGPLSYKVGAIFAGAGMSDGAASLNTTLKEYYNAIP